MEDNAALETRAPVVVGFDGSRDAVRALRWAATWSQSAQRPLRVVAARGDLFRLSAWADNWTRGLAEEWLDQARKILADRGLPDARFEVLDAVPAGGLVDASTAAALVVVGSHGEGPLVGALQGSVSQHVSRHAACPVVVVRGLRHPESNTIVVGVDGSPSSLGALEFALVAGEELGHRVRVIMAADRIWPPGPGFSGQTIPRLEPAREAQEHAVLREVDDIIVRHPGVAAEVRRVDVSPIQALLVESRSAALVVVGSHGRGAFAGLLLGSVSAEVLRHAECPVAVIR
jgi:nucleotide-binding universal stress UspA family protein